MATARSFEDLDVWQEACNLVKEVYLITVSKNFDRDLSSQIRRAAISISSNIAEGFERGSNNEFSHFLSIAKGSAGELRSQLFIAHLLKYLSDEEFEHLKSWTIKVSSILSSLMNYLKRYKSDNKSS